MEDEQGPCGKDEEEKWSMVLWRMDCYARSEFAILYAGTAYQNLVISATEVSIASTWELMESAA